MQLCVSHKYDLSFLNQTIFASNAFYIFNIIIWKINCLVFIK